MKDILTPSEIETIAKQAEKSMMQVCREAGVAQSTWTRWKAGRSVPNIHVYQKILDAARSVSAAQAAG